jgi:hypothetical protein
MREIFCNSALLLSTSRYLSPSLAPPLFNALIFYPSFPLSLKLTYVISLLLRTLSVALFLNFSLTLSFSQSLSHSFSLLLFFLSHSPFSRFFLFSPSFLAFSSSLLFSFSYSIPSSLFFFSPYSLFSSLSPSLIPIRFTCHCFSFFLRPLLLFIVAFLFLLNVCLIQFTICF